MLKFCLAVAALDTTPLVWRLQVSTRKYLATILARAVAIAAMNSQATTLIRSEDLHVLSNRQRKRNSSKKKRLKKTDAVGLRQSVHANAYFVEALAARYSTKTRTRGRRTLMTDQLRKQDAAGGNDGRQGQPFMISHTVRLSHACLPHTLLLGQLHRTTPNERPVWPDFIPLERQRVRPCPRLSVGS